MTMASYKNHLIDPSYFYDAIEQFAFNYDIYIQSEEIRDEYFRTTFTYSKQLIRGSLQTQGLNINRSKHGNTNQNEYNFYCKSLYRINIGDFIYYKNQWLLCDSVHEYDEWGVREAHLTMVQLTAYKDLLEYVKYINGEEIV